MKLIKSKKALVLLGALVVAAAASIGAYAYFTAAGAGNGTAHVGSSSAIELSSPLVGDLYPGGADVPVTVTIKNPGGGAQYVGTVSGTVEDNGGCLGTWFVVDPVDYKDTLAAGASDTVGTNVRMLDSGGDQNVCKGKTVTIDWSSN
jgi:hypothetical protein